VPLTNQYNPRDGNEEAHTLSAVCVRIVFMNKGVDNYLGIMINSSNRQTISVGI